MLEETLVVCMAEFGRTPRYNGRGGRDHWGPVFSVALAGGGHSRRRGAWLQRCAGCPAARWPRSAGRFDGDHSALPGARAGDRNSRRAQPPHSAQPRADHPANSGVKLAPLSTAGQTGTIAVSNLSERTAVVNAVLPAVEVSQTPEEKFREYLASRPCAQRFTTQQRDMVNYIFSKHNHFDADELIDEMKREGFRVSPRHRLSHPQEARRCQPLAPHQSRPPHRLRTRLRLRPARSSLLRAVRNHDRIPGPANRTARSTRSANSISSRWSATASSSAACARTATGQG